MKKLLLSMICMSGVILTGCEDSASEKEARAVQRQQKQYQAAQPVPAFNYSLERDIVTQLYQVRNQKVSTHSVWVSETGKVIGDCPSIGYGVPYDTSLTNPLAAEWVGQTRYVLEQAEPNGIFLSKNTSATWVLCTSESGKIDPVYVESRVNVYPYLVDVNYATDRITKAGKSNINITLEAQ